MNFSRFSDVELERRRKESVEALRARDRAEFDQWYQEKCDTLYWSKGKCCAGCDYWGSAAGNWGACQHAGIVDGHQVLASMGVRWHTYHNPEPGYPRTPIDHVCANFKDDFDWSTLDPEYLVKIGARFGGITQDKPSHSITQKEQE